MKTISFKALTVSLLYAQLSLAGAGFSELATGGNRYTMESGVTIDYGALSGESPEVDAANNATVPAAPEKKENLKYYQSGIASNYWQPQSTGCPPYKRFNPQAMTAAHKKLPCGTKIKVTNLANGKSVVVTINDRGPYSGGRILDLSKASFLKIASEKQGLARVKIEIIK